MGKYQLKAGAGKAPMNFSEEAFPTSRENYTGIHDLPHVRVLILEDVERYVLINLEIVNIFPDTREKVMQILYRETGVKPENIWYHNCHVLSTPHAWPVDQSRGPGHGKPDGPAAGKPGPGGAPSGKPGESGPDGAPSGKTGPRPPMMKRTPQEQKSVELVSEAICEAAEAAARQAAQSMTRAVVGCGWGHCEANANRNLELAEGWWVSCNDEGVIDHNVPILRIDDESGNAIAVLFGFHAQPAVLDMLTLENGDRLISGDIAGYSSAFVEEEFPGSVAMYFTGAGGDGTPYFRGSYFLRGRNGRRIDKNRREKSYLLAEMIGERLGQQVVMAAEKIQTAVPEKPVSIGEVILSLPGRPRTGPIRADEPTREFVFTDGETIRMPLSVLTIGDMAFVGLLPEITQKTALRIETQSPYPVTMVSTFTNSGPTESGIGKYMGTEEDYDRITFQAVNSMFARGAAEQTADEAVRFLKETYAGHTDSGETEQES